MLKKLFCKHDYKAVVCEKTGDWEQINDTTRMQRNKIGVLIVCEKCGKRKKKVEKLITKLIVKEKVEYYNRSFENEYQRFYHQGRHSTKGAKNNHSLRWWH